MLDPDRTRVGSGTRIGDGTRKAAKPTGLAPGRSAVPRRAGSLLALVASGTSLLAAAGFLIQPYQRSEPELIGLAVAAAAAIVLLLLGVALTLNYRNSVAIKAPLWKLGLTVVLILAAGSGLGAVLRANPETGPGPGVSTGPAESAPSPASCPADAALASETAGLHSPRPSTRLAAISGLRQAMTSSPDEQCAVINVLCAFIREDSPATDNDGPISQDIQAALSALANRNPAHDGDAVIELGDTNLTNADLADARFAEADLSGANGADLTGADLAGANLSDADLANAYLGGAILSNTDLSGADLTDASLYGTALCSTTDVPVHPDEGYNCTQ